MGRRGQPGWPAWISGDATLGWPAGHPFLDRNAAVLGLTTVLLPAPDVFLLADVLLAHSVIVLPIFNIHI